MSSLGACAMDEALRLSGLRPWSLPVVEPTPYCRCGRDGDCYWSGCPQERDGEPAKTGRNCPLDHIFDVWCEEYGYERR